MANLLTHDIIRQNKGKWTCVNCGRKADSIELMSTIQCPSKPKDNDNIIKAINGNLNKG